MAPGIPRTQSSRRRSVRTESTSGKDEEISETIFAARAEEKRRAQQAAIALVCLRPCRRIVAN